jgi:hypothetical protein
MLYDIKSGLPTLGAREQFAAMGEAVSPRTDAPQRRFGNDAWRLGVPLKMSISHGTSDYGRFDELAEEFAERIAWRLFVERAFSADEVREERK